MNSLTVVTGSLVSFVMTPSRLSSVTVRGAPNDSGLQAESHVSARALEAARATKPSVSVPAGIADPTKPRHNQAARATWRLRPGRWGQRRTRRSAAGTATPRRDRAGRSSTPDSALTAPPRHTPARGGRAPNRRDISRLQAQRRTRPRAAPRRGLAGSARELRRRPPHLRTERPPRRHA